MGSLAERRTLLRVGIIAVLCMVVCLVVALPAVAYADPTSEDVAAALEVRQQQRNEAVAFGTLAVADKEVTVSSVGAGGLQALVDVELGYGGFSYADIGSLTVQSGVLDATDFAFICENLSAMKTLDISGVALPSNKLPDRAFCTFPDWGVLTTVRLPSGISIGEEAFKDCRYLTTIGDTEGTVDVRNCTAFGTGAFYYCVSIEKVVLPDRTSLSDRMFALCVSLYDLNWNAVHRFNQSCLYGCAFDFTGGYPVGTNWNNNTVGAYAAYQTPAVVARLSKYAESFPIGGSYSEPAKSLKTVSGTDYQTMLKNRSQYAAWLYDKTASPLLGTSGTVDTATPGSYPIVYSGVSAHIFIPKSQTFTVNVKASFIPMERVSGSAAVDTAVEISREAFPSISDAVVLARNDDYMDAMSATGLAGALDAPILLTDRYTLSATTGVEIDRLNASKVYIIGGAGAIGANVENAIVAKGISVERVFGKTAGDTSVECAKKIESIDGGRNTEDTVIVATSTGFSDAISVSSYAYKNHIPIFIVSALSTNPSTDRVLNAQAKTMIDRYSHVFVPGGNGAVPRTSVEGVFGEGKVERVYGSTGFDTSNAVAEAMVSSGRLSNARVGIANGEADFKGVDAIAAASLCGKLNAPLVLVDRSGFATGINAYLSTNASAVEETYVFGGKAVVPIDVYNRIAGIVGAETSR